MPVSMTGKIFYTTNASGGNIAHGAPVRSENMTGVAVRTKIPSWSDPPLTQDVIANGEDFSMIVRGVVQVPEVAGFAVGDAIYITAANVLTEVSAGNSLFGRVVQIEGERGTPTNHVRIDLDAKDSV